VFALVTSDKGRSDSTSALPAGWQPVGGGKGTDPRLTELLHGHSTTHVPISVFKACGCLA